MTTNLDVLLEARTEIAKLRESLYNAQKPETREVLIGCIELMQIVINQSEDEIRKGNP